MKHLYESILDDEDDVLDNQDFWLEKNIHFNNATHTTKGGITNVKKTDKDGYISFENVKHPDELVEKISKFVKFGVCDCDVNTTDLISLKNGPTEVTGNLSILFSDLKTLKYAPVKVGKNIEIVETLLKDLIYFPVEVGGKVGIKGCHKIKSLKGLPNKLKELDLLNLDKLESLNDLPKEIGKLKIMYCKKISKLFSTVDEAIEKINSLGNYQKIIFKF